MVDNKPTFYMMVGIPGSGKTTYAHSIPNAEVFSSDEIRKEMGADGGDKKFHAAVFRELHKRIVNAMQEGKSIVYDATNIKAARREEFLREIKTFPYRKVCVFMSATIDTAKRRNQKRGSTVPELVIVDMAHRLEMPWLYEGWDEIHMIRASD